MPIINHAMLSWARESVGLTIEDAAKKLQFKDSVKTTAAQKLKTYEDGDKGPSRAMLAKFSSTYRMPLLTFYLKNPPIKNSRGEDFRSLPDEFEVQDNILVDALLRDIKARQSALREALIDEDEGVRLDFIDSRRMNDTTESVVRKMYEFLDFDLQEFRRQISLEIAFKYLRNLTESAGVFVILKGNLGSHHTDISVQLFRGFALSDDVAPFVVINDKDAKSAWSFTLAHELAHLALGRSGVSGVNSEMAIEKFCNAIASEFFLPDKEFQHFTLSTAEFESTIEEISGYAKSINLSSSHIAYRLFKRGDINRENWQQLRGFFRQAWMQNQKQIKKIQKAKDGGPDYYTLRRRSLGGGLLRVVHRYIQSGTLSTTKAAMLLGVKPLKVHKLFE
jgi:Zn-dependent peptidase ImmA (M78 family)